jgi:hypothetical protein
VTAEQALLIIIEGVSITFLIVFCCGLPVTDWWMRRRIRKEIEYRDKLERHLAKKCRRYESVRGSKYHSRN